MTMPQSATREFADVPFVSGSRRLSGHRDEVTHDRFAFFDRVNREVRGIARLRFMLQELLVATSPTRSKA